MAAPHEQSPADVDGPSAIDEARLPRWMQPQAVLGRYRERTTFDRPAPEQGSQVPPHWGEGADEPPDAQAELDPVVDLNRLPSWMKSQGYVPIAPTLNSRSRANRAGNEGEEGERPWWEWRRLEAAPDFEPSPLHFEADLDSVDATPSDLPAELDWAALPRWMRAVPEQGPPDEQECEAGSGPGWE